MPALTTKGSRILEIIHSIHTQVIAFLNEKAMPYTLEEGVFVVDQIRDTVRFTTRITADFFNGRVQTLIVDTSAPLVLVHTMGSDTGEGSPSLQPCECEQVYALVSLLNPVTQLLGSLSFDNASATINHTWRVPIPATLDQKTFTTVVNAGLNSIDGCRPELVAVASGEKTATAALLKIISPRAQADGDDHALIA